MRIASWNVNSMRARIERVIPWLLRQNIDIVAFQETKCNSTNFPYQDFVDNNYQVIHHGFNQWNGVAIAAKAGSGKPEDILEGICVGFADEPEYEHTLQARALGATYRNLRLWSVYVPNGRSLDHPHYRYKLAWLDQLYQIAQTERARYDQLIFAGDWNIAPRDEDVWDMREFVNATHVSESERERFGQFLAAGFYDPIRNKTPGEYTYWDYTQLRFPRNEGMRIDYMLTTEKINQQCTTAIIDRNERKGKKPSDHAPLIIDVNIC